MLLCQLKKLGNVDSDTTNSIENFLDGDEKELKRAGSKKARKSFLSPPDEQTLKAEKDEEGDDSAEKKTGVQELVTESANESDISHDIVDEAPRWLKTSLIVASHNFDVIAIAAVQRFVVLQNLITNKNMFESCAQVSVAKSAGDEVYITSILPLCIASTCAVNSTNIDWTCICVGLSDGTVRFYTERGICVFVEKCSYQPIKALRFGSSIYPGKQELVAFTAGNKLIIFEGLSLFTVLKTARNQIALNEKSLEEISDTLEVNCHCVELDGLQNAQNVLSTGLVHPVGFDQYVSASCSTAGKEAHVARVSLPIYTSYVGMDCDKLASFIWHNAEVSGSELLSDMINTFTNQIANSIPIPSIGLRSFLGIGTSRRNRPSKARAVDARSSKAYERSALFDAERQAERCYLAPADWPLLAVADSCARVLLINTECRRIIRIWKGYRNARCAWIESASESQINEKNHFNRSMTCTLFLVIFAPKRGLLEVWSMENGPRVSAFKVHEKGRLLSVDSGYAATLIGSSQVKFGSAFNYTTAAFLFPDGSIFKLTAPFHMSAMDVSVLSIHDDNLLNSFNIDAILSYEGIETEFSTTNDINASDALAHLNIERCVSFCKALKTAPARRRFLEILIDFMASDVIKTSSNDENPEANGQPKITLSLSDLHAVVKQLIVFAMSEESESDLFLHYIQSLDIFFNVCGLVVDSNRLLKREPHLSDLNYNRLQNFLELDSEYFQKFDLFLLRSTSSLHETDNSLMDLKTFKKQFELCREKLVSNAEPDNKSLAIERISLHKWEDLDTKMLGRLLFGPFVRGRAPMEILFEKILPLIDAQDNTYIRIFLDFWLDSSWNVDPQRWTPRAIDLVAGLLKMSIHRYEVIDLIEQKAFKTTNLHAALMLYLIVRAIRLRCMEKKKTWDMPTCSSAEDSNTSGEHVGTDHKDEKPTAEGANTKNDENALKDGPDSSSLNNTTESFSIIGEDDLLMTPEQCERHILCGRIVLTCSTYVAAEWFELSILHFNHLTLLQRLPVNVEIAEEMKEDDKAFSFKKFSFNSLAKHQDFTFERLLSKGFGFYREMIGVWCVLRHMSPDDLKSIINKEESEDDSAEVRVMRALQNRLPLVLRVELLLGDCAWESMSAWSKDESRRVTYLKLSVDYLRAMDSAWLLKHGIAAKMWTTFLQHSFKKMYAISCGQNEYAYFSSVASKDRVLKRDVLITESDVPKYVERVRSFLRILANAAARLTGGSESIEDNATHVMATNADSCLRRLFSHNKSGRPEIWRTLCGMACRTKPVNYHLVMHHLHLATALTLITELQLRIRPHTLFDEVGRRAFFASLDSHPLIPLANVDDRTRTRRQRFFEKVVEQMSMNGAGLIDEDSDDDYNFHWRLIVGLSTDWELDLRAIRVKEIVILYQYGFDSDAEKRMSTIDDKQFLMQALFPIIAARIKHITDENTNLARKILQRSAGSMRSSDYIKNISDSFSPKFPDVNPQALIRLLDMTWRLAKAKPNHSSVDEENEQRQHRPEGRTSAFHSQLALLRDLSEVAAVIDQFYGKL